MAEKKSKDVASKADHEPTAKTEAKAEGSPKAEQPAGMPAKAEPETKDKPEAKPGAGPSSASGGGSWLISRAAAWVLAIILGLVIVSGFPLLIDRHRDEVADLRAELEAERQAIDEYPNVLEALEVEVRKIESASAELAGLQAEREDIQGELAETRVEREARKARIGKLEAQIAALEGERRRLDELVLATSDDLQAAMDLLEAARGRMSQ